MSEVAKKGKKSKDELLNDLMSYYIAKPAMVDLFKSKLGFTKMCLGTTSKELREQIKNNEWGGDSAVIVRAIIEFKPKPVSKNTSTVMTQEEIDQIDSLLNNIGKTVDIKGVSAKILRLQVTGVRVQLENSVKSTLVKIEDIKL